MEPHLYLRRGKKEVLLVRYFDQFHFISLDHRMHSQVKAWFLAQPRTVEEMNRRQLSRSSVDLKDIRGVAVGGLGRGQVVQFYLKEGKRRYELYEDCEEITLSALFHGLESFTPPKQQIAWQDWRLARQTPELRKKLWFLGGTANVFGMLSGWITMSSGYRWPWLNAMCLLCLAGALILYFCYPAYFTILEGRRRYGDKKSVFGLYPVVILVPVMLIGAAMARCHVFGWWKAWLIGAVAVIALTILLWKFAPEFRDPGEFIGFVLVGTIFSAGPVLAVNYLLDFAPVQEIRTEVVDSDISSGRGGTSYYLYVDLTGEEIKLPVPRSTYEEYQVGDRVTVDMHNGALGIPYAEIE